MGRSHEITGGGGPGFWIRERFHLILGVYLDICRSYAFITEVGSFGGLKPELPQIRPILSKKPETWSDVLKSSESKWFPLICKLDLFMQICTHVADMYRLRMDVACVWMKEQIIYSAYVCMHAWKPVCMSGRAQINIICLGPGLILLWWPSIFAYITM